MLVIGAQKAGTTTLHHTLAAHPDAFMSSPKELNFFQRHFDKGPDWYAEQFAEASIRGETSPSYAAHELAAKRIAELVPDVRLIYLVRDPVDRLVSAWMHGQASGRESRSFPDAMLAENPKSGLYFPHSAYGRNLGRFMDQFPKEQILVESFDDVVSGTATKRVLHHVGLDPDGNIEVGRHNDGASRRRPPWVARSMLSFRDGWRRPQARGKLPARVGSPRGSGGRCSRRRRAPTRRACSARRRRGAGS